VIFLRFGVGMAQQFNLPFAGRTIGFDRADEEHQADLATGIFSG